MATWITHLMIADRVLERIPKLDRRGFCVGNIAPDCNVENEDWTRFVPSRELTHWMSADRKKESDSDRFYDAYIAQKNFKMTADEEISFLLGYYAHLITDAEFQRYIRDDERVASSWLRIQEHHTLANKAKGMPKTWDSVKELVSKSDRMQDIYSIEAEYLAKHPDSGYLTEILSLKDFPDYLDYLPQGAIVRKIGVMGYLPQKRSGEFSFIAMTREEYSIFFENATEQVVRKITQRCKLE